MRDWLGIGQYQLQVQEFGPCDASQALVGLVVDSQFRQDAREFFENPWLLGRRCTAKLLDLSGHGC